MTTDGLLQACREFPLFGQDLSYLGVIKADQIPLGLIIETSGMPYLTQNGLSRPGQVLENNEFPQVLCSSPATKNDSRLGNFREPAIHRAQVPQATLCSQKRFIFIRLDGISRKRAITDVPRTKSLIWLWPTMVTAREMVSIFLPGPIKRRC